MRFLCFIGLSYLLCFQLKAQSVDFVFKEELNLLVAKKEGKSPNAFEITKEEYTKTINTPSSKRISQYYKRTLAFAEKCESDSLKIDKLKKETGFTPEMANNLNEAEVNNRLRIARRALKNAEKYEIVPGKVEDETYYKLKIKRNIFKPQHVIIGDFESLGLFYVTKSIEGNNENDLITVVEAKKRKLTSESFLFKNEYAVIQNIKTKVIYMVFPDFLEKYPLKNSITE